jgi:Txe/YoeB family toxin of toxin-antitoxin system
MRSLVFEGDSWAAYEQLRQSDKKRHENLCKIIQEMLRGDPKSGLGKPEPLKYNLSGFWSRRDTCLGVKSRRKKIIFALYQNGSRVELWQYR